MPYLTLFPGFRTEFYSKVEQNTTGGYVGMVVKGHKGGNESAFNGKLVGIALFPSVDHSLSIHLCLCVGKSCFWRLVSVGLRKWLMHALYLQFGGGGQTYCSYILRVLTKVLVHPIIPQDLQKCWPLLQKNTLSLEKFTLCKILWNISDTVSALINAINVAIALFFSNNNRNVLLKGIFGVFSMDIQPCFHAVDQTSWQLPMVLRM